MRAIAALAASCATILGAAACGGSGGSERGLLVVDQVREGRSLYIEGSYSYVRVSAGGDATTRRLPQAEHPSTSIRLDPGDYRLESWQRPCDGNCGYLDPPTDRCDQSVSVAAGDEVHATVRLRPGEGCSIAVAA